MPSPSKTVNIQWTKTAVEQLDKLPRKVAKMIVSKASTLLECDDPRQAHKPLTGELDGCYTIKVSRYRAIYNVDEQPLDDGTVNIQITVTFVAVGKREEGSRKDVYALAKKMADLGM